MPFDQTQFANRILDDGETLLFRFHRNFFANLPASWKWYPSSSQIALPPMSCKYLWAQTLKHEYVPTRFPFTNVESLASFQRRFRHAKPLVAILISWRLGQPIIVNGRGIACPYCSFALYILGIERSISTLEIESSSTTSIAVILPSANLKGHCSSWIQPGCRRKWTPSTQFLGRWSVEARACTDMSSVLNW